MSCFAGICGSVCGGSSAPPAPIKPAPLSPRAFAQVSPRGQPQQAGLIIPETSDPAAAIQQSLTPHVSLSANLVKDLEGTHGFQSLLLHKSESQGEKHRLQNYYKMPPGSEDALLGEGGFGSVKKMIHMATGKQRAVKSIEVTSENVGMISDELSILLNLDHPNVLKVFEWYHDPENDMMHIVTEICRGGELQDLVLEHHTVNSAALLIQVFHAVQFCHGMGVVHRDMKLENCLLKEKFNPDAKDQGAEARRALIKVIDFGLAATRGKGEAMSEVLGTPYYIAPEVLQSVYDEKCDVWALGVMMYMLLTGEHPFVVPSDVRRKSPKKLFHRIKTNPPHEEPIAMMTPDARDLVLKLLEKDHTKRISAAQALAHPWCERVRSQVIGETQVNRTVLKSASENMQTYCRMTRLERVLRTVAAREAATHDMEDLRKAFFELDKDGNGKLSREEIAQLFEEKIGGQDGGGSSAPILSDELWAAVDTDGSGEIGYTEFLAAVIDRSRFANEETIRGAFQYFDLDNNGYIDRHELELVVGEDEAGRALKRLDRNGSGDIDCSEFATLVKALSRKNKSCLQYCRKFTQEDFVELS